MIKGKSFFSKSVFLIMWGGVGEGSRGTNTNLDLGSQAAAGCEGRDPN